MSKRSRIVLDNSKQFKSININAFPQWYEQNKAVIDTISTKTFNFKFHIVDDNNKRYKLERRKGEMRIVPMNPDYQLTKHDILNQLAQLEGKITELSTTLNRLDTEEKPIDTGEIVFPKITKRINL